MYLIDRFVASLIQPRKYESLAACGVGSALLYLGLIIAIVIATMSIGWYGKTADAIHVLVKEIGKSPDFKLRHGRLRVEGKMPYISISGGSEVFIIDTREDAGQTALNAFGEGMMLTATGLYMKRQGRAVDSLPWSIIPFEITRDGLADFLTKMIAPIFVCVVAGFLFYTILAKGLTIILLGLLGWLIGGATKPGFGRSISVACYALTGPILFGLLKYFLFPEMPFSFAVYWGLALFYVIYASLRLKKTVTEQEASGGMTVG